MLGQIAPVVILPLFYKIEKLDAPELADRIARLAAGTGLSIEGVYRLDLSDETVKANAMLAGLGPTRRVLLGDTLIDGFPPEEIEVIFAHEIGHHVFHHIRKIIVTAWCSARRASGFAIGCWRCGSARQRRGRLCPSAHRDAAVNAADSDAVCAAVGAAAKRRSAAVSSGSATATPWSGPAAKTAYLSAFRKLARLNKDDPNPHWLDVLLFHSHPPVQERLAMAEDVLG